MAYDNQLTITEADVLAALDDDAYELERRIEKWERECGTVDFNGRDNVRETLYLYECDMRKGWTLPLHYIIEAGYRELA